MQQQTRDKKEMQEGDLTGQCDVCHGEMCVSVQ